MFLFTFRWIKPHYVLRVEYKTSYINEDNVHGIFRDDNMANVCRFPPNVSM